MKLFNKLGAALFLVSLTAIAACGGSNTGTTMETKPPVNAPKPPVVQPKDFLDSDASSNIAALLTLDNAFFILSFHDAHNTPDFDSARQSLNDYWKNPPQKGWAGKEISYDSKGSALDFTGYLEFDISLDNVLLGQNHNAQGTIHYQLESIANFALGVSAMSILHPDSQLTIDGIAYDLSQVKMTISNGNTQSLKCEGAVKVEDRQCQMVSDCKSCAF